MARSRPSYANYTAATAPAPQTIAERLAFRLRFNGHLAEAIGPRTFRCSTEYGDEALRSSLAAALRTAKATADVSALNGGWYAVEVHAR